MEINHLIKKIRKSHKLTQTEFGAILNCDRFRIADLERGKSSPAIDDIRVISKHFNISADYLLGLSETPSIDEDVKRVCNYTGLTTLNVKTLNYLKNNIIGSGFIDFLNMMIEKISANDRLVIDIEQVRENKTTYTMIAEKIIEKGIGIETEDDILRLEDLKYITNGLSYEITTAINRIYENYTLSNCGYNIEQFEELQQELK